MLFKYILTSFTADNIEVRGPVIRKFFLLGLSVRSNEANEQLNGIALCIICMK